MKQKFFRAKLTILNHGIMRVLYYPLQTFTWLTVKIYLVFHMFTGRIRRRGVINLLDAKILRQKQPVIFVANHQSMYDPFFISEQLPFRQWVFAMPVRYFVHPNIFKNPLLRWAALLFGNFPAKPVKNLPHGIEFAKLAMEKGHSIFIFPEGRRVLRHEGVAKTGVVELLEAFPKAWVVPCHIEWHRDGKKRWFELTIGEAYRPKRLDAREILDFAYSQPLPSELAEHLQQAA